MKAYSVNFEISISDKATTYPVVEPIKVRVQENLPVNVDAHKYIRQRIAEELTRQFAQLKDNIDNKTEDAPEEDALA